MGFPLFPIIANIVMQDFEREALDSLNFPMRMYFKYVDDILTAAPENKIQMILNCFNSLQECLKFTLELGTDNSINFLN